LSFDIYFVERPADGNWDAAMDAQQPVAGADASLSDGDLVIWEQIKATVLDELPNASEVVGDRSRDMDDESLRLQVSMFPTEISLSVPYWSEGDEAEAIVGLLQRLTGQVEQITDLVGYDTQADCPFLEGQPRQAVDAFDHVRVVLDEHAAPAPPPPSVASPAPKRQWWPFRRT
jgi:hypothetical protein